uniref:Putative secreted protein n=1 Tax=Amblyomma triste TaxID=251400 RepID=A0A023FZP8_AMBTT
MLLRPFYFLAKRFLITFIPLFSIISSSKPKPPIITHKSSLFLDTDDREMYFSLGANLALTYSGRSFGVRSLG